ncbi:nuclear transport factor 2 family protein [Nocardia sp. CA-135953]|uniref:nuclear transport factor 2 family protein n=1 Tax=Nocardia sp. CA-135953 TaxID=3239978 RepID=UPI003D988317
MTAEQERISVEDRVAIHELLSLYGHIVDDRQLSRTGEVFADDAVYDVSDFGSGVHHGPAEITALWTATTNHPLAHHTVDVVVTQDPDGTVHVVSKGIGLGENGRAGSVTYRDIVRRTPQGWRISRRVAVLRRPDRIPPIT